MYTTQVNRWTRFDHLNRRYSAGYGGRPAAAPIRALSEVDDEIDIEKSDGADKNGTQTRLKFCPPPPNTFLTIAHAQKYFQNTFKYDSNTLEYF